MFMSTGRYRLLAESWLGGDNRSGRLNMWGGVAWFSGLVASVALPLKRFAELAFCLVCVAQRRTRISVWGMIFVCVQPYSTTLFGVPFPLPTPQGRWDRHLRDKPETEIRGLR